MFNIVFPILENYGANSLVMIKLIKKTYKMEFCEAIYKRSIIFVYKVDTRNI